MATTFEQFEIGDNKIVSRLNINFSYVPRYLGELGSAPSASGVCEGSTYYNTSDSYLYFLNSSSAWVKVSP